MYMCKGICEKFKATKNFEIKGRYESGQKRCKVCGIFLNYDNVRCPCCSSRLRSNPRSTKLRNYLRIQKAGINKKNNFKHFS